MLVLAIVAWVALAAMALVLLTLLAGWSRSKPAVALQAGAPYLLALSVPIAAVAAATGRWVLAAIGGVMAVVFLATLWPLRFPPRQPPAPSAGTPLRIFHGNLLYYNGRTAEMARAVAALEADVLAFTEYTPTHSGGLYVAPLVEAYPYRIEHPDPTAGGSAIWSRHPIVEIPAPPALYTSTAAVVEAPEPVTVYVVHPPNPMVELGHWLDEHARLAALRSTADGPAILVGDLNASYWHPPLRRLLNAGWRDAHHLAGRALSCSWPTDRWWLRPFLRLDHALVSDSLVVIDIADVDVPGSDHRGLVVAVVVSPSGVAAPATRSR